MMVRRLILFVSCRTTENHKMIERLTQEHRLQPSPELYI